MSLRALGIGMTSQRTRDRLINRLREEGITDEHVLEIMRNLPRHLFIDEALSSRAYEDTALPIGYAQTISQPYIVALMTQMLFAEGYRPEKVLEIGTGSGYQAAVLAKLIKEVYTVERIQPLLKATQRRLRQLGIHNIKFRFSDGGEGWPEHAPYDAIIVTAATGQIPRALFEQLAENGRMVIPVGEHNHQDLLLIQRDGDSFAQKIIEKVKFVPLVHGRAS